MDENFSIENSRPIMNNRNITPNSEIALIRSVECIKKFNIIPVKNKPIMDGSLSLLNISNTMTAVISTTDISFSSSKSMLFHP